MPLNLATASLVRYQLHPTWEIDYAKMGYPRWGVWHSVPCLGMMFTYFPGNDDVTAKFRGERWHKNDNATLPLVRLYRLAETSQALIYEESVPEAVYGATSFEVLWLEWGKVSFADMVECYLAEARQQGEENHGNDQR